MNRKRLTVCTVTIPIIFTILFIACRKNGDVLHENIFNAPAAKEWFYATFKKTTEYTAAAAAGKQLPDWKTGRYKKTGNMEMVEYDLVQQKKTALVAPTGNRFDDKRIAEAAINRALFVKQGNETKLFIIQFIPGADYARANSYDISKNNFISPDKHFTGKLLVKQWNNELVKGYNIANGKKTSVIKQITKENPANRTDINDGCLYSYFAWFEQDCTIVPIGDNVALENCSEWQMMYESITETYCPASPMECELLGLDQEACMCQMLGVCGNGGGEDEEPCVNVNLDDAVASSPASEFISATTTAQNATSRTRMYKWTFARQIANLWHYDSYDKAVIVKTGNSANPEKYQSLTHDHEDLVGTQFIYTLDCKINYTEPTVGLYNAIMKLDYTIKASLVCRGMPGSRSLNNNASHLFQITD